MKTPQECALQEVRDGRSDEAEHFALEYIAEHCADPFSRELANIALSRADDNE